MRDSWEELNKELADTQRQTRTSLAQLSSFEENLNQFQTWLTDVDAKIKLDSELQPTLSGKKSLLETVKV